MPIYWGMPPTNGQAWWSTTNSTSSSTTWYPVTTSATGIWYTNTPTTSQYLVPLEVNSRLQWAAYLQQVNALQQQQQAMLAAQQDRYQQPMGQLNGGGQLGLGYIPPAYSHENALRQLARPPELRQGLQDYRAQQRSDLAAPAVLRRPRRSDEAQEAYDARREAQLAEITARDAQLVDIRQRAEEAAARRRGADQRAFELLREHLSEAQLATLATEGYFIVIGQRTGRRYRIRTVSGIAGNIDELAGNDNRPTHRLCCHMEHAIPTADHFLAQKLMLESAEDDFLRIANRNRA